MDALDRQNRLYQSELALHLAGEKLPFQSQEPFQQEEYRKVKVDWVDKICENLADEASCEGWAKAGECQKNYYGYAPSIVHQYHVRNPVLR